MMVLRIMIIISSLAFLYYGILYFTSPYLKNEFKRFGLEKFGVLTAILEILGAIGLLIGLQVRLILLFSSGGLSLLMFLGVMARINVKDSLYVSIPAFFFMVLNGYIFYKMLTH